MPYPDTEYEYFEHRGGMARPMVGPPGPGAPLLPPVKYNEEVRGTELYINIFLIVLYKLVSI